MLVKAMAVKAMVVKAVVTVKQVTTPVPAPQVAEQPADGEPVRRQGRPRSTSRRALEVVALSLFTERGFDETTVDQIAAAAGVGRRTFFRYFDSKTAVLWNTFDLEVDAIRRLLADSPKDLGMMDAIRGAVVAANHYHADDVPELRCRMNLISSVPALQANATLHYAAWEDAIVDFAAQRCGQPADSLYPLAVGRATLAVCRAAFDRWVARADADLQIYLDAALRAMTIGFSPQAMTAEPSPPRAGTPKRNARRRH